jgi:hypothetical protein
MSLLEESNVTTAPEAADNVRMDEIVCEQFDSYKSAASKTLNEVNDPVPCLGDTCSLTDPDEWWSRQHTRFPLVYDV